MTNQLYTIKDLMALLKVKRSKLYELISEGLTPSLYLGNSPRWYADAISSFLVKQPTCRSGNSTTMGGTK
jgi:predicted DNA-binding transcriptional regulator AlpA